jgi:hypothetical protein
MVPPLSAERCGNSGTAGSDIHFAWRRRLDGQEATADKVRVMNRIAQKFAASCCRGVAIITG